MNTEKLQREKTQEFLAECKKAGYERVTIFIHDKRLPLSCERRKSNTGWGPDEDGMHERQGEMVFSPKEGYGPSAWWGTVAGTRANDDGSPPLGKVVCAEPPQRSACSGVKKDKTAPAIWNIVRGIGLNSGGAGYADSIDVDAKELLTPGYYDLSQFPELT